MEKGNFKEEEDNCSQPNAAMINSCKQENSQDEHESGSVLQTLLLPKNESRKTNKWTAKEDMLLKELVATFGEKSWRKISSTMNNRSAIQCLHRWSKILKPGLVKGPWTSDEDQKLMQWVSSNGSMKWSECSSVITGRSGKQCRERWFNNLNPDVKKGNWTEFEDNAIFQGYFEHGSSWSRIAKELEGRTENSVKNRFYSTVRKLISDLEKQQTNIDTSNQYHPCTTANSSMISQQSSQQPMISGSEGASNIAYSNQRIVEVLRSITNDSKFCKKEKITIPEKEEQINAGIAGNASTADEKNNVRTKEEVACKESEDEVKQQLEQNNSEQKIPSRVHSNGQNIKNNSILQTPKQPGQEYSEQNYLYRLILNGNVNIKKTASMQDYAMLQKNKLKGNSEFVSSDKERKMHKGKVIEQDQQQHSQEPKKKIKKTSDNRSNENGEQQQVVGSQVNRQQGQGQSRKNEKHQKDQLVRDGSQMEREDNKLVGQKQQRQQDQLLFESLKRKLNNRCEKQEEIEEEEEDNSDEGEEDGDEDEDDEDDDESEISEQFSEEISKAMSASLAKFMKSKLEKLARSITQNYSKQMREQPSNIQTKIQQEAENMHSKDRKKLSQNMGSQIDQNLSDSMVLKSKKSQDKIEKNETKRIDQQKKSQQINGIVSEKNNEEIQPRQQAMREENEDTNYEILNHQLKLKYDKEELQKQQQQYQQQEQQVKKNIEEAAESQRKRENSIREQQQQHQLQQQQQQKQQTQLEQQEQLLQQQKQLFLQSLSLPNGNTTNATEEVRGEGRIDFLISQLNSLMSLLNTTKNELNKLESSQKQPSPQPGWVRPTENQLRDTTKNLLPFKMHGQQQQPKQSIQFQKQQQQQPSQGNKEVDYAQIKQPYKLENSHQHSILANPLNTNQNNTDYFDSSYSLPFLEMDQFSGLFNNNNNSHINSNQHEEFMKQEHPAGSSPFRKSNIRSREFLSPQNTFGQESLVQQNEEKTDGFQQKQILGQINEMQSEIHN